MMMLFITGLIFGLITSIFNYFLLRKALRKAEETTPLKGYLIFNQLNFLRIILNIFVLSATAIKGVPAVLGALTGLLTQIFFYIYQIKNYTRKG